MSSYGLGVIGAADHLAAADIVAGENGHDLFIPRLPGERIGALTAALLEGLHLDIGPRTMRLLSDSSDARPAAVLRRLTDSWHRIWDSCEALWPAGAPVRIQVAGPWSLAAGTELVDGHRVLTDPGARRDLADALAEAIGQYLRTIQRRFASQVQLQLDEPMLPAAVSGGLSGIHEWDIIAPVAQPEATELLARTLGPIRQAVSSISMNLPGEGQLPWTLLQSLMGTPAQIDTVIMPMRALVGSENLDGIGQLLSNGTRVGLGVAQSEADPREIAISIARLWDNLALRRESLVSDVDVVPDGDLVAEPVQKLKVLRQASEMLVRDAGDL